MDGKEANPVSTPQSQPGKTGRQAEGIGERTCSRKRSWETEHSESISTDFTGAEALNSVAHELYDLLDLPKSIRSLHADGTEALLKCDGLTPPLLIIFTQ